MEMHERLRRENEAFAALDRALSAGSGRGSTSRNANAAADEQVSGDEQVEIGNVLLEYAEFLEGEYRAREAYPFLSAVDARPKWGPDADLLAKLFQLALELGLKSDAAGYRRRLVALDRDAADAVERNFTATPALAPPRVAEVRYAHPKFGVGILVREEADALRVRFDDGERVILKARLTLVE